MDKLEELKQEYLALGHAIQTGVAWLMGFNEKFTQPKHLRTGINMAMVDHGGLVRLLVQKGVITEQEYWEAMVQSAREEKARYEEELSGLCHRKVTLA